MLVIANFNSVCKPKSYTSYSFLRIKMKFTAVVALVTGLLVGSALASPVPDTTQDYTTPTPTPTPISSIWSPMPYANPVVYATP